MKKIEDITIIKYLKHNDREYGAYIVDDILIVQNEDDYKAIIHEVNKPVDDCLTFVNDYIVWRIKNAVKELNNGKN